MKKQVLIYILFAAMTAITGCKGRPTANSEDVVMNESAPLPTVVDEVITSITANNPSAFAANVSYPLERPYPLHDITDSAQMVAYYPILVDDSLRNVVKTARRKDWSEAGWRGWTLDAGQYMWFDEKLYAMPYLSEAEKAMLNVVITKDIESLPKELREGWTPAYCLEGIADGTLYRVDHKPETDSYRMLVYPAGKSIRQKPAQILAGSMRTEGSESNRIYTFRGAGDTVFEYASDDSGEGMSFTSTPKGGKSRNVDVNKVYWLDYAERVAP